MQALSRCVLLHVFNPLSHLRKYYFSNRVIQIWNSLPDSVVESKSINSFKNNLDKFWQNEDVKFNWKANLTSAGSHSLSLI